MNIQHFDIIDSTNSEASRQIDDVLSKCFLSSNKVGESENNQSTVDSHLAEVHKKIIVADSQTAGRGRLNRAFYSPDSTGVYMSLIWVIGEASPNTINPEKNTADCISKVSAPVDSFNPALYTATAAVGVTRAIKSIYGIDTQIKWVNDIYLGEKKICGILVEGKIDSRTGKIAALIVGIGVNIATPKGGFPTDCERKAGALLGAECTDGDSATSETTIRREELIKSIAQNVFQIYEDESSFSDVIKEYREKSNLVGKKVFVSPVIGQSGGDYEAEVLDITENAELKVRCQNGEIKTLSSGEISLHFN